jgi:hypothetical protein
MTVRRRGTGISFGFGRSVRRRPVRRTNVAGLFKGLFFFILVVAVVAGFAFLDKYVKEEMASSAGNRTIELIGDIPSWVSEEIRNRVYAAATAKIGGGGFDENTAALVQQNIQQLVPWLDGVRVQTTHKSIRISGRWRKPIAVVTAGKSRFFLDADLVVLDYIPVADLPIVTVAGLDFTRQPPAVGQVWQGEDLAAGLAVLSRLERMDAAVCPDKPLMREIDRIDVSNFNGRKNKREPHIVLYTKGNTQIIWGAEIDTWQRHLESPDDDKLAKLYTYYQQTGTLSGVKYINLRDPQQTIYLPVDKY